MTGLSCPWINLGFWRELERHGVNDVQWVVEVGLIEDAPKEGVLEACVSDVTAIWNTNAFFAYVIAVKLFGLKWEPRRLLAVIIATFGVVVVVYGGSTSTDGSKQPPSTTLSVKPSSPLVGDLLTLVASIGYGLYQVLYKKYAASSTDPEIVADNLYDQIPNADLIQTIESDLPLRPDTIPKPPFGLYANFLTCIIGLLTLVIVWLPIPFLHYWNIEPFRAPPNLETILTIAGISISGMVLLGIWGPIITSVGNLLTIVLVFMSDIIFGAGIESLTVWSVVGCGVIVAAFAVLAYDMFSYRS
ncbi:hypothetical protein H0H93_002968 [Arthromyces matolae]|nr:hypothetical protein H0H93_002968 [Arthromyces matolae]